MSNFKTISNFFSVDGSGLYIGQVVASRDALYLAAGMAPVSFASLFAGRVGKPIADSRGPLKVHLSELPAVVTSDPTWRITTTAGFVCSFDRHAISGLRCSLTGNLHLSNFEHSAVIRSGFIKRFAMLRILRQFGWQV